MIKLNINTRKAKEIFLEIKLSVNLVKGQMGKKKEFQSICYQVHMSAQFFSSWISNADYLIPQSAPVDLLLSQLKHALDFFFLITSLASCLCISAGPGQRKFSHHLTVPVTGDLFFFLMALVLRVEDEKRHSSRSQGTFILAGET